MRGLLNRWRDRKATQAAKLLTNYRIRKERELVHRVARQLCVETGMKVPLALKD